MGSAIAEGVGAFTPVECANYPAHQDMLRPKWEML